MRLGVAGAGLIGGSIALRARGSGATVSAFDLDAAALVRARDRGAIDTVAPDLATLAAQCDTLVIALPVDATRATLETLALLPAGALPTLVIDVASVKAGLLLHDAPAHFVATHPMAGSERGGIDAAKATLFVGATWAYVPPSNAALVARVRSFIESMGARPFPIDGELHDEIVALTSHLPQTLSVLLGRQLAEAARTDANVLALAGPGMLSMLRLARSPETVWEPIVAANARPLARALRELSASIDAVAAGLEQADISALMSYFADARRVSGELEERFSKADRSLPYP